MRWSQYFIPTLKTVPKDIKSPALRLLIKSGMLRVPKKGCYYYLPLGLKLLQKLDGYIRSVVNKYNGLEISHLITDSSAVESADEGTICFRRDILQLFTMIVSSYRQLPLLFYHFPANAIKTGKKDKSYTSRYSGKMVEIYLLESESGKDTLGAEKLDNIGQDTLSQLGLKSYEVILFKKKGIKARWILCHDREGEHEIAHCSSCNNLLHPAQISQSTSKSGDEKLGALELVETPEMVTVDDVGAFLKKKPQEILKTIILTADGKSLAVLLRGDVQLDLKKLKNYVGRKNIKLADENLVWEITDAPVGFSGPIGLKREIPLIGDFSIIQMVNCVAGANKADYHYINVNLNRDFKVEEYADLSQPYVDESCPSCNSKTILSKFSRIAEAIHPFGFAEKPIIIDGEKGKERLAIGCLTIDIDSLLGSIIERYKDEAGIFWPPEIAPFEAIILLLNPHIEEIKEMGDEVYFSLTKEGVGCLLDDRSIGAGAKFSDAELLGIPLQIILGKKYLESGQIEMKMRKEKKAININKENLLEKVKTLLSDYNSKIIS